VFKEKQTLEDENYDLNEDLQELKEEM